MRRQVAAGVGTPILSAVAATKSVQLADLRPELRFARWAVRADRLVAVHDE